MCDYLQNEVTLPHISPACTCANKNDHWTQMITNHSNKQSTIWSFVESGVNAKGSIVSVTCGKDHCPELFYDSNHHSLYGYDSRRKCVADRLSCSSVWPLSLTRAEHRLTLTGPQSLSLTVPDWMTSLTYVPDRSRSLTDPQLLVFTSARGPCSLNFALCVSLARY